MMNAALKMAAPGELCVQSTKLMEFCKVQARSIKAMRQHLGVTHERINTLLGDMLAKNLLWRQHNTLYKTVADALHLVEPNTAKTDSMAALADLTDVSNGEYTAEQASELASAHEELNINAAIAAIDNASELDMAQFNETKYISEPDQDNDQVITGSAETARQRELAENDITELFEDEEEQNLPFRIADAKSNYLASEFAPKPYDLTAMANEFEAEQERGDQHVIDNLDAKQRVLNYCQMLLSPTSTEMRRCLDELQMDLAVIRLQQERSI